MTVNTDSTEGMRAKWDAAVEVLRKTDAEFRRYAEAMDPLCRLEEAYCAEHGLRRPDLLASGSPYAVPVHMEDERERLCEVFADAETALMATPAPDLSALRWKLHHTSDTAYSEDYTAQMRADIERLMGPAPSLLPIDGGAVIAAA